MVLRNEGNTYFAPTPMSANHVGPAGANAQQQIQMEQEPLKSYHRIRSNVTYRKSTY